MSGSITINGRRVGPSAPVYVIAELSCNHGQDYGTAVKIIEAAKAAGADAVKLQTYTADTITLRSDQAIFRIAEGTPWAGRTLYDLYQEAFTPWEWQPKLKAVAQGLGLDLFSSPFDFTAVDFLEKMGVPAYKIASFEAVDVPLIQRVARTGKPVLISTGMATWEEIGEAVKAFRDAGGKELALLKCTSAYPAKPEEMNLRGIPRLAESFGVPVGLSDHTMGTEAPAAAVALGACLIEKHLMISRAQGGPDSAFSLEPAEFKAMVDAVRAVEKALGKADYGLAEQEKASRAFRRSLFVVEDMKAGEVFTEKNLRSIRPANGLPPRHYAEVMGQRAARAISRGTPLAWDLVEGRRTS